MRWEQPARLVVAAVGIATAVVIYRAIQPRTSGSRTTVVHRVDPRASVETTGAVLQQVHGAEEDFELTHERALSYPDGSTKQFGVRIAVRGRGGRDYVVTAAEASAGAGARSLELSGQVSLVASDGFSLKTESAVFDRDAGLVRAPGPVSFSRGRMVGQGVGMTYDQNADVLNILAMPSVTLSGSDESVASSFSAGTAVLDRTQNFLRLEGQAHVAHGEQAFDSETTMAHLTEDEQFVTLLELRGRARVSGGAGALESMTARDINMVYAEDGAALERVALSGGGVVVLKPEVGERGRTVAGEALDLTLGPDGALASVLGRGGVRLDTPAAINRAARVIRAMSFEASGAPGAGLTTARFVGDVEYREEAGPETAGPEKAGTVKAGPLTKGRVARSRTLDLGLEGEGVRSAAFDGAVTFEEAGGVRARAATLRYTPQSGALLLAGSDAGGGPRMADDRITIEAERIDVGLEDRRVAARGAVKTTVAADQANSTRGGSGRTGLLDRTQSINVNAEALSSSAKRDTITYTGEATLWQGEVAIRADVITLDEDTGDLSASGQARSTLPLDGGVMFGRAEHIRYDSTTRVVAYDSPDARPAPGRGSGATARATSEAGLAQLSGTHGDVHGRRIEVVLGPGRGSVDRVEAYRNVAMTLQARRARGDRLTYHADDQRYVLVGTATAPVSVVDACRAITGKTLTFFRSTDRILVDGDRELRTRTTSDGPCEPAGAR